MEAGWRSSSHRVLDSDTSHWQDTAMPDDDRYSLTELADLAGVTPGPSATTSAQGLLPSVGQTGPGSKYGTDHLARLRLIRRLQAEHLPLAEIRRRLDGLDRRRSATRPAIRTEPPPPDSALDYLRTVLAGPSRRRRRSLLRQPRLPAAQPLMRQMAPAGAAPRPRHVPRRQRDVRGDRRTAAASNAPSGSGSPSRPMSNSIIRRPLTRAQQKQVDRLVTIARELLEEDRP